MKCHDHKFEFQINTMANIIVVVVILILMTSRFLLCAKVDPHLTRIWGPGLRPDQIIMPARYFFIQAVDNNNNSITESVGSFQVKFDGESNGRACRIWTNVLDRKDGSYIVRYKVYEPCKGMKINVMYNNVHIGLSPYSIHKTVASDDCNCPINSIEEFLEQWECGPVPQQILKDFEAFPNIHLNLLKPKIIEKFDKPHSVSICNYAIKDNKIYRKCYGKYVGFNMFMDAILKSLSRKIKLPDIEFFVNLGDWPLSSNEFIEKYPILSWCGSLGTYDIIMPTYDITESSLENMGRVMLDMLSVQGNTNYPWDKRKPQMFWRGRDSNRHRLDLIKIARAHPDLFNASITNFFFFRDEEHIYGPKSSHVSFFSFFDYKYQLSLDGTVAAYRLPYLLAGGSLLFKQDSKYYEFFYNELEPYVHYVPIKKDLSNLLEKLEWAIKHEDESKRIAKNGRDFANEHLLPKNIFCYHAHLFKVYQKRFVGNVEVSDSMERVEQDGKNCFCDNNLKDEL